MNDILYVPPLLCLPPNRDVFPDGPTTYYYAYGRQYSYYSTNLYGYYCYALVPIAAPIRRKKSSSTPTPPPPCPDLCIVGLSDGFSPPPLTIGCSGSTQALLEGAVPAPYANQLFVQSPGGMPPLGTPPYIFSVVAGSLPPDVTLSVDGLLSGNTILEGTFTFTIQVTDSNGCTGTQEFTINVTTS